MNKASILSTASELRKRYGIPDPEKLCKDAGIILLYSQMGTEDYACKGFILKLGSTVSITINSDLPEDMQKIILIHELSHFFLHVSTGLAGAFQDFSAFSEAEIREYEANLLTAELLISDTELTELLSEGFGFFECAAKLRVPAELLDFKLRLMREKGAAIAEAPISALGGFMQHLRMKD